MRKMISVIWITTGIATLAFSQLVNAQSAPEKLLVGEARVETVETYKGPALAKPDKILVANFVVPSDVISMDESMGARLHRRHLLLRGSDPESTPESVAQQVQATFARTLVSELQKTPLPTEAASNSYPPRVDDLVIQGEFTAINEGNRGKRIMIGFGRGASDVQAHVTVSLATARQPIVLSEFNLNSESGKKPGAAATMGVGSGAASAATGSHGDTRETVEADASRMAKAVAKQVEKVMASQKWIPPATLSK